MSNILRHLARNRAKETMRKKGMIRICSKEGGRVSSYFANNWRPYAYTTTIKGGKK